MRTRSLDYILNNVRNVVCSIDSDVQDRFIDLILSKKTIFIYGSGRSGLVGQLFAVRLVQVGLDVHFVGDMTTPIIRDNDLTILVSNTGETMSAVQTANIAKRIGSCVVCITGRPTSKLANTSDVVISLDMKDNTQSAEYAPLGTIFEDTVNIFFDSLIPCIMKRLGVTENDMRKNHAIWV